MKKIVFLFLLVQSFILFAQDDKIENHYVDYFKLPRESLFLHSNKTSYITGEEIWFKVYTYDRKNHLSSKATTNIILGIYDEEGKQVGKKLFLAKDGFATGNIAIDPEWASGTYFLKVATNWMKNFEEDDSFVQKIRIINPNAQKAPFSQTYEKEYDIQFLPEGGHILSGVKNTVGIKAIDDTGKGTRSSGILFNAKGKEVATFKSNFLGLGKFSFTPVDGEIYTAKISLSNGKELEQQLPLSKAIGVTIQVNNLRSDKVIIDLLTNETSLERYQNERFKLLIHKDGTSKIIPIEFNNLRERISIDKKGLFKGVNTLTLVNSKEQPILERMFFNESQIRHHNVAITTKEHVGDSITYQIRSTISDSLSLYTSISVLPKETISYTPRHNILSAFYLQPYVKGFIENPRYYFTKMDRKKRYELDVLLLTQGWSRYDWNRIFRNPPKPNFEFEDGISVLGHLNNNLSKVKDLLLFPTAHNTSKFIHFDEKGKFLLKNFYPMSDEVLRFSLTSKRGKAKAPKIAVSSLQVLKKDSISTKAYEDYTSFYSRETVIPLNFITDETEVLDEIVISSRLDRVFNKIGGPPFQGKIIKINDSIAKQFVTLDQIINQQRFLLEYGEGAEISVKSIEKRPVVFYLDGQLIHNFHNFINTNTTSFEDVYIDYSYNNVLINGQNISEVIIVNVFSRISPFKDITLSDTPYRNIKLGIGFEPVKKFYTPRYVMYDIKSFRDNGVIHWEPNATVHSGEAFEMTTVNTGLKDISFYVEGISNKGDLISQIVRLNVTNK